MSGERRGVHRDTGATLPELLVVLVVLGLLAVAVVAVVGRLRSDAVATSCVAERATLERAAALWQREHDESPSVEALVDATLLRDGDTAYEFSPDGRLVARADSRCGSAGPVVEQAGPPPPGAFSERPAGGTGDGGTTENGATGGPASGDGPVDPPLEVTLTWTGNADLDLWLRTPSGELVGWTHSGSDGAHLTADVVPPSPDAVGPHVERIVWPASAMPTGEFHAVAAFRTDGWGPQTSTGYVLTLRRNGAVVASAAGPISPAGTQSPALVATVA